MPLINERDRQRIKERFDKELGQEVTIDFFTQKESSLWVPGQECPYCRETRQLLEEVAALSDKIRLNTFDFLADTTQVQKQAIDKIPAIVLSGRNAGTVRYFGIPSGYEFSTLLQDIIDVAKESRDLAQETRDELSQIEKDTHIQVFVTPTWPYCPSAARLAHLMAMENAHVTADVVEITEFPHLAQRYQVRGVPKVVINDRVQFEGAVPERAFVAQVLKAQEA